MLLVARELAGSPFAAALAGDSQPVVLTSRELRPGRPLEGRLFEVLAAAALPGSRVHAAPVGLLVPAVWLGADPRPDLLGVTDHVNLRLRGALTGRWPAGAPRSFPDLSHVYEREPALGRPPSGARVYSGLTVAGVGDVRALTPFERRAVDRLFLKAASDRLVDAVILAAYHGLSVAAWCAPRAT